MQLGAAAQVSTTVVVVVAAVALLACVPPVLAYVGSRQRKAVMAYAEAQGWAYRDLDATLAARYSGLPFVTSADARAEAVISGLYRDKPFAAYAYTFQGASADGSGKEGAGTQTIPIVALTLRSGFPDLDVVPDLGTGRGWGAKSSFTVVPSSPEFGDTFVVRCEDRDFASSVLGDRLMHGLMAFPDRAWAFRDGDLLSIGSWNGKPEKIVTYLDHLGMILDGVPSAVWEAFDGRSGRSNRVDDQPDQPNSSST